MLELKSPSGQKHELHTMCKLATAKLFNSLFFKANLSQSFKWNVLRSFFI